jgi:hypothetical protein
MILLSLLAIGCALLLGFFVQQASTCAVTAAKEIVIYRKTTLLRSFLLATGTAGMIVVTLATVGGDRVHIAGDTVPSASLALGAAVFGLGAVVNDACLFGTLSRIGQGQLRFLMLFPGLAAGFFLDTNARMPPVPNPGNLFTGHVALSAMAFLGFAAAASVCFRSLMTIRHPRHLSLSVAMSLVGVTGSLLYALQRGWSYTDVIRDYLAMPLPGPMAMMTPFANPFVAVAMVLGSLAGGLYSKNFRVERPRLCTLLRSFVGGLLMAVGILMIPGGNDTLLLSAMPALTLSGLTAYTIMTATILFLTVVSRRLRLL